MTLVAWLLLLSTHAHAQVDTGAGTPPRKNLDLPRDPLDLRPPIDDARVPPPWRDVERGAAAEFHPRADLVSTRSPATLMATQLQSFHAAERAIDEGHGDPAITMSRDPRAELRRRFEEEPAEWVRTQIQVDVAADGALESIAVVVSSGTRALDEDALRAVKRALARSRVRGKSGASARFACDAGVVAAPPLIGQAQGDPRGSGVTAGMRIRFDETTGKVTPQISFVRRVVTRIRILDYAERKAP